MAISVSTILYFKDVLCRHNVICVSIKKLKDLMDSSHLTVTSANSFLFHFKINYL